MTYSKQIKRIIAVVTILGAVQGFVACGGGGNSAAPTPVVVAPTKAVVSFKVDPNPQNAEYQGSGWWKFRVNLEFVETAGVGFTINSIRYTIINPMNNSALVDRDEAVASKVAASGRTVLQFASANYFVLGGLSGRVNAKFIANITDDKGNALTLSSDAVVNQLNEEEVELN